MTIDTFQPLQRIPYLFKGLIKRQRSILLQLAKKIAIKIGHLTVSVFLSVQN